MNSEENHQVPTPQHDEALQQLTSAYAEMVKERTSLLEKSARIKQAKQLVGERYTELLQEMGDTKRAIDLLKKIQKDGTDHAPAKSRGRPAYSQEQRAATKRQKRLEGIEARLQHLEAIRIWHENTIADLKQGLERVSPELTNNDPQYDFTRRRLAKELSAREKTYATTMKTMGILELERQEMFNAG
jgi:chromosome segregation ATPase